MATVQHALQCVTQFIAVHGGCVLAIAPDAYAEVFDAVGEVVGVEPDGGGLFGEFRLFFCQYRVVLDWGDIGERGKYFIASW